MTKKSEPLKSSEKLEEGLTEVREIVSREDLVRNAPAYHEAGHAVIGVQYGWKVNHEGVEIIEREYTGMRRLVLLDTTEASVVISLAGWASEYKYHSLGFKSHDDDELLSLISDIRYWEQDSENHGDGHDAFIALLDESPNANDNELIHQYRYYENICIGHLEKQRIWQAVERVAQGLIEKGKLNAEEVEQLIWEYNSENCGPTEQSK